MSQRFSAKNNTTKIPSKTKDLKLLSLFSGCGGMDLGFEGKFKVHKDSINEDIHPTWLDPKQPQKRWQTLPSTRFKTVFANDIRPGALKAWHSFFGGEGQAEANVFHLESIVDRVKRQWNGEKGLFPEKVDVLTGGFPCQDFSVAGKRKGFESHKSHNGKIKEDPSEENRGKLYLWMREVIDIVRPKVFIAENVKGLVSLGDVKEIIQRDFEDIGDDGYLVLDSRVLHAADFGVPQSRERVFFIGLNKSWLSKQALESLAKGELDLYPQPTHQRQGASGQKRKAYVSLRKVFQGLKEPLESKDLDQKSYSKAKWYGSHCQGNREINLDGIGPTIRAEHHGNIEFRRLSPQNGGNYHEEFSKSWQERRLSIRECCRIQTFPDDYKFVGEKRGMGVSASEAYKLIGNAVPPLLAYHLASTLESKWEDLFGERSD